MKVGLTKIQPSFLFMKNNKEITFKKIFCDKIIPNSTIEDDSLKKKWRILNIIAGDLHLTYKEKIGSLRAIFKENKPENLEQWKQLYIKYGKKPQEELFKTLYKSIKLYGLNPKEYTKEIINNFVCDLIFDKSFSGFMNEKIVLNAVAKEEKLVLKDSEDGQDSKGIDSYLNDKPVQVKPVSFKSRASALSYHNRIIFYNPKTKYIIYNQDYLLSQ